MSSHILLFLLLLLTATASDARVFKWVDSNGETHYSEAVPKDQQALEMHESSAPVPAGSVDANHTDTMMQQLESAEAARKARNEAQQKEAEERQAAIKNYRCTHAKHDLHILQQQVPVYSLNDKGERVYVDDDKRAQDIKELSDVIADNCE